jgi:hypothetical protein
MRPASAFRAAKPVAQPPDAREAIDAIRRDQVAWKEPLFMTAAAPDMHQLARAKIRQSWISDRAHVA